MKLPGQERIENLAATGLRAWLIVGILLRVTRLRDRFDGLALVFYSTPWPVIAAGFVGLALHYYRRGNGHAVRRYAAFTLVALFTWVATSWFSTPPAAGVPALTFIQWNVAGPDQRLASCAAWMRQRNPDIICLSEFRPIKVEVMDRWRREFPDYVVTGGHGYMLCLVRGEVLASESGILGDSSYFTLLRLRVGGRPVNLLQMDGCARAAQSRRATLARLVELTRAYPGGNLIVAGDFNTPRESYHLDPLRADFTNAFEAAGRGFAETWPVPTLALTLDQVWVGRRWRVLDCVHGWSWLSDHRPVAVKLAAE
ncbi:MAG: endonuclease/exonuclease/phosphatase family protein [Chthoniobacteraceae bacterium]